MVLGIVMSGALWVRFKPISRKSVWRQKANNTNGCDGFVDVSIKTTKNRTVQSNANLVGYCKVTIN